jgi:hypothetical protein
MSYRVSAKSDVVKPTSNLKTNEKSLIENKKHKTSEVFMDENMWTVKLRKSIGHKACLGKPVKTPKEMGWLWSLRSTGGVKVRNSLEGPRILI